MGRSNLRFTAAVPLSAVLLLCSGCQTYDGPIGQPARFVKPVVAVEKFRNRARFPLGWSLGDGMAEMLVAALVRSQRVTVVSRAALSSVFDELELQRDPRFRKEGRVGRGRLKNAQYLIRGRVIDFTHTAGGGAHFLRGLTAGRASASVAMVTIAVSVINVESRQVFTETFKGSAWASQASLKATYKDVSFGGDAFRRTPLGKATQEAIWSAVQWLVRRVAGRAWQPLIAKIEGDVLYLSGGRDRNVRVGEDLEVRVPGQPIVDPATGDEIGRGPVRVVGRLRVTEVRPKLCLARILSGKDFRVGQMCHRLTPPPDEAGRPTPPPVDGRRRRR